MNAQELDKRHNGWTNRETWVVDLWLTSEEDSFGDLVEIVNQKSPMEQRSRALMQYVRRVYVESGAYKEVGLASDLVEQHLLNRQGGANKEGSLAALRRVNWDEIIRKHTDTAAQS